MILRILAAFICISFSSSLLFAHSDRAPSSEKSISTGKKKKKKGGKKKSNQKSSKAKSGNPVQTKGKALRREVVFTGSTVNGKYHSAGEAVTKVEQEKQLNDLIGMRRDYKDRLAAERDRLKRKEDAVAD